MSEKQAEYNYQATTPHAEYTLVVAAVLNIHASGEDSGDAEAVLDAVRQAIQVACQCYSERLQFSARATSVTVNPTQIIDNPAAGGTI